MCEFYSCCVKDGTVYDLGPNSESHHEIAEHHGIEEPYLHVHVRDGRIDHDLPPDVAAEVLRRCEEALQVRSAREHKRLERNARRRLRRLVPDGDVRTIVERAGNGSALTAERHIKHVRAERAARRATPDVRTALRRRALARFIASKSDDELFELYGRQLASVQRRCRARCVGWPKLLQALRGFSQDLEPRTLGDWTVAKAYYDYGVPCGTFVTIDQRVHIARCRV